MNHLQEIGEFLHEERTRQQISLEDLSRHTCVSIRMLEALEQGQDSDVGTPLLIRGFIRSYCNALGIDPEPLLEKFAGQEDSFNEQDESLKRYGVWMRKPSSKRRYVLYSVIAAVILTLGFVGASIWLPARSGKNSQVAQAPEALVYPQKDLPQDLPRKTTPQEQTEATSEPASETKETPPTVGDQTGTEEAARGPAEAETLAESAPTNAPTAAEQPPVQTAAAEPAAREAMEPNQAQDRLEAPTAKPAAEPTTAGHVLVLEAVEETWLQVQNTDGKKENRLMKPGEQRRWEVPGQIRLWLGNAGGIRATWDGRALKPFGKRGQVVRLKLPDPTYLQQ